MFFKIFLEPMTACVKVIKPNNRNSASSGSSRGRKCTNAPNASKYPQIRLNSIPTFHLYFTISNILYICVINVDRSSFHPPICVLPLLERTASMGKSGKDNLGKRSREKQREIERSRNVKEIG
jgi:hypothetical protein